MHDELGLDYTTDNPTSLQLFTEALENYLASSAQVMPCLERLFEQDPTMPMALLFRAYLLKLAADPRFRAAIQQCFDSVSARPDLNDREQRYLKALSLWQADQMAEAAAVFDDIVLNYPKDMLALRMAHYLHFYGNGGRQMMESLQVALQHHEANDRYYGFLKGMHSFALEESGRYPEAEAAGLEALDINRKDIWAAHAVTHVYQMQSRFEEAIRFIESLLPEWTSANNFVYHLHWHKALLHIGLGNLDQALNVYDETLVEPLADDFYLDVCNATSLLWRLEMSGVKVGDRWAPLHELSKNRVQDNELVFTSLHYLITPAILGDAKTVKAGLDHFHHWSNAKTSQGTVAKIVGETMAKAVAKLASEQKHEGVTLMQSVQNQIYRIGGSHAQRHLFDQLINSYS
ncbi:MAG: tetratricopeptide repeat protein [Gammaproteobacteria bacterium]|jgi:tetratricopeptide (TPR) repeat protein|nr:tetratricopeptide repeat protein [Gammaproteobacteria bacterium]MBT5723118.1 tetratricopeptide repeat protein [Gammaproteobacteria bacterium]MBT6584208.1 tetratricopeptide repeat protein [Gammaproteobacteria bacterium]